MKNLIVATGGGLAAMALILGLVACGSDTKTEEKTSTSTEATTTTTSPEAPTTTARAAGPNKTIQDYVKENNIQETALKHGDPGPTVELPVPEGWAANDSLPESPYGAIVYQRTAVPNNAPRILAFLSKLTGNVDPAQILALAPGELRNLPGYDGPTEGQSDTLGGYDAVQLGGNYDTGTKKGMIAQKTAVIPGPDPSTVFVLQLNAYADESETGVLADATNFIDEHTTITP